MSFETGFRLRTSLHDDFLRPVVSGAVFEMRALVRYRTAQHNYFRHFRVSAARNLLCGDYRALRALQRTIWLAALRWKPITYIGKISYSMYLIHIPVYVAVGLLWGAHTLTYTSQILHGVAAVFCTIALSAISWKYFESPILALRDRPFSLRAVRSDLSIPVAASTSD
jgi:peptidoglycan/LPS O-acetylase OafA/YrhL